MATSQIQSSQQMIAQLRLLNPNYSAEVGTPERWILDTVADALTDSHIDLIGLENALNIDTKFGANLDNFVALFGFARQGGTKATGYVVFSRNDPAATAITIPSGVVIQSASGANETTNQENFPVQFVTTASTILREGATKTSPVPVIAISTGILGDIEAHKLSVIVGEAPFGVTEVSNPAPTTGGSDQENDNSLKVRFKNTVFRNLAGTKDQYLALAVSTAFSAKANVVGPVSQYKEYIQLPAKNDTLSYAFGGGGELLSGIPRKYIQTGSTSGKVLTLSSTAGMAAGEKVLIYSGIFFDTDNDRDPAKKLFSGTIKEVLSLTTLELSTTPEAPITKGVCLIGEVAPSATEWTTALSTIPFAKNIWTTKPAFITNGQNGIANYFFREGVDYTLNYPAKVQGDTIRAIIDGVGVNPITDPLGKLQPNVTFTNVYEGKNEAVQAVSEEQVVLLEYSYTSSSSRNDLAHNVTNCVDVFVDGVNEQPTSVIFAVPTGLTSAAFVEDPTSVYYVENYRRDGEPTKRPLLRNVLTPLLSIPVVTLPEQIQVKVGEATNNYYLGTHYWLVHDVSEYAGTIRARDGIEWSAAVLGDTTGLEPPPAPKSQPPAVDDPALADPPAYAGTSFLLLPAGTAVEVANQTYDKNIPDLQAALDGARQITTDVLAHKAKTRYFKLDLTAIYEPGSIPSAVNQQIHDVLDTYLKSRYFGSIINLSDLLQQVHSIAGINNIRWTADVPKTTGAVRVYETDANGLPLLGASISRIQVGNGTTKEKQRLFVTGKPNRGAIFLTYGVMGESVIEPVVVELPNIEEETATQIKTAIAGKGIAVSVEEDSSVAIRQDSLRSFTLTYTATAAQRLPVVTTGYLEGEYTFAQDFFLRDNELPALPTGMQTTATKVFPADSAPGLIVRPRAQGTWLRAN